MIWGKSKEKYSECKTGEKGYISKTLACTAGVAFANFLCSNCSRFLAKALLGGCTCLAVTSRFLVKWNFLKSSSVQIGALVFAYSLALFFFVVLSRLYVSVISRVQGTRVIDIYPVVFTFHEAEGFAYAAISNTPSHEAVLLVVEIKTEEKKWRHIYAQVYVTPVKTHPRASWNDNF